MRSIIATGILTTLAVLAADEVQARQEPLPLTIEDAVARAAAEAPRIAEARALEAAADALVASRNALRRPTLAALSGVLRTNHVEEFGIPQAGGGTRIIFPDLPNNYRMRAELMVPVYTGGRVRGLVDAASADRRAAEADRHTATADVVLDTVEAYWMLVTARARVGVLERAQARADAALADVRVRVDTGFLPPNEALAAQAQRARQHVHLIQAQNEAALAEALLGRLIGAVPGQPIVPATDVGRPVASAAGLRAQPFDALLERALASRPERRALAERERGLREASEAAAAQGRPQVGVVAAIEPARPNPRFVPRTDQWHTGWDLGVNVSWALWDGGRARAERAGTAAQADAVAHRAREFDRGVAVELRQRLLELTSTEAALAASTDAVEAAAEARRVLGERFAAGVATSTEVLDADLAWLDAELERTELQARLRMSEARLARAVGP